MAANEFRLDIPTRVLVVDDVEINVIIAIRLLQRYGIEVDTASDGEAALDCLRRRSYDLVLLDCQMPVMDGFETARAIREDLPHPACDVSIIAYTSIPGPEIRKRCLDAGMDDYLAKPLARVHLDSILSVWLGMDATWPLAD